MISITRNSNIDSPQIEISDSGFAVLDSAWKCENVCDPFSRIYYVTKGTGYLKWNGKTMEMTEGQAYLVPANLSFSYGCTYLEKLFFHVSVTKTDKYDLLSNEKEILSLPISCSDGEKLLKLYEANDYMSFINLKSFLLKTIYDFSENYRFEKILATEYSETVKKTINYIHGNIRINLSTKEIAQNLFMSESKIRNKFRREVGVTLGEYIDDVVFFKAKMLLKSKELLIADISEELGFCDQFYFCKSFKRKFEKTPTQYRKEII